MFRLDLLVQLKLKPLRIVSNCLDCIARSFEILHSLLASIILAQYFDVWPMKGIFVEQWDILVIDKYADWSVQ